MVPGELTHRVALGTYVPISNHLVCAVDNSPINIWTPLISMFLHGGWGHILGNAIFFWVFGNNIEDSMGPGRFLVFYLLCGLIAAATHVLMSPTSPVPTVGASGAISGVLGAYLVLYPRAPVTVFVFIFFISLPAWVVIGEWFLLNLTGGVQSLGLGSSGGVAFFAHIGGFLAGVLGIRAAMVGRARAQASVFSGFRNLPRSRFGLPPGRGGSGVPGPGPGRWDSWR